MIKEILKKIHHKIFYGYKSDSLSYIKYLKKCGVTIGKNVTFYEPNTNYVDIQTGFMINIGNNVEITRGVVILTHDYSWSVLKVLKGEVIGSRSKVSIGNNVFIGINSVILKGVSIGDNVIIGANSVITKDIPSNSIVCGAPAKIVSNIDSYYKKRKSVYANEAKDLFKEYYKKYKKVPKKQIFREFFWLFEERKAILEPYYKKTMQLSGNFNFSNDTFLKSKPMYNGYDDFVKVCLGELEACKEVVLNERKN